MILTSDTDDKAKAPSKNKRKSLAHIHSYGCPDYIKTVGVLGGMNLEPRDSILLCTGFAVLTTNHPKIQGFKMCDARDGVPSWVKV